MLLFEVETKALWMAGGAGGVKHVEALLNVHHASRSSPDGRRANLFLFAIMASPLNKISPRPGLLTSARKIDAYISNAGRNNLRAEALRPASS